MPNDVIKYYNCTSWDSANEVGLHLVKREVVVYGCLSYDSCRR